MVTVILLAEYTCEFTLGIFDFMSFIDDDIFPIILVESESILEDEIIGRDADIPLRALHLLQNIITSGRIPSVDDLPDGGRPFIELRHPVRDSGERNHD